MCCHVAAHAVDDLHTTTHVSLCLQLSSCQLLRYTAPVEADLTVDFARTDQERLLLVSITVSKQGFSHWSLFVAGVNPRCNNQPTKKMQFPSEPRQLMTVDHKGRIVYATSQLANM